MGTGGPSGGDDSLSWDSRLSEFRLLGSVVFNPTILQNEYFTQTESITLVQDPKWERTCCAGVARVDFANREHHNYCHYIS